MTYNIAISRSILRVKLERRPYDLIDLVMINLILSDFFEGKWMDDHQTTHWSEGLGPTIFSINTRTTCTTKSTPYQLVFGQNLRSDLHYWRSVHDASMACNVEIDDLQIDSVPLLTSITEKKAKLSVSLYHACSISETPSTKSKCEILLLSEVQKLILSLAHIGIDRQGFEQTEEANLPLCSFQVVEMTATDNQK